MTAPRVLFLASDLGPTGAARQLTLLAPRLGAAGVDVVVVVLGRDDTPFAAELRAAGVPVHAAPLRKPFDVRGWRHLRTLADAAGPSVVHAWGPAAVRLARAAGGGVPVVASAAADPYGGVAGWLTRRALRRADRVVAATWGEAERYRRLGVCGDDLTRIPPAAAPAPPPPDRARTLKELDLPESARVVLTAGEVGPSLGMKSAVWVFDMLRYEFRDLHLVIAGGGPDAAGLEDFRRAVAYDDTRVRYAGPRADLRSLVAVAEQVWVLQPRGGLNFALEAMAAGRPVVAWANPDMIDVVDDGETGLLATVGERAQVSALGFELLRNPAEGDRLGAAGRARAAERFAADKMAVPYARVYHELSRR